MTSAAAVKYIVCLLLCVVVSVVYTATKKSRVSGIAKDSLVMLGYLVAGMFLIGVLVQLMCLLK